MTSRPVYYYAPLYRAISDLEEVDLTVVYSTAIGRKQPAQAEKDVSLYQSPPEDTEGFRHVYLPGAERVRHLHGLQGSFNPRIVPHLLRERYDVVWIHGYHVGTNLLSALVQLFLVRGEVLLRDDQHLRNPRSTWNRRVKKTVLPPLFRRFKGLFVGTLNREWLREYGIKEENLHFVPHAVPLESLACAQDRPCDDRDALRRIFGIDGKHDPVILSVGRMISQKDYPTLINAFARVRARHACTLLLIGDGPERDGLEAMVNALGVTDDVVFAGAKPHAETVRAYRIADLFVLPSQSETWGLVVNEAMLSALPVIVSNRVGSSKDLVRDGENGFVFETGNVDQLEQYLEMLVASRETRQAYGAASARIIPDWSYEAAVNGARKALGLCNKVATP